MRFFLNIRIGELKYEYCGFALIQVMKNIFPNSTLVNTAE